MKKISLKHLHHIKKQHKKPKSNIFVVIAHKLSSFLGDVHHKIQRNKFLSNQYFTRIVVICFFLGINIQLLPYFLKTTRVTLPQEILTILDALNIINKEEVNFEHMNSRANNQLPSLDPQVLFAKVNEERIKRNKVTFEYNDGLASAAAELLAEAEKYEFELKDKPFTDELKKALKNADYNYEHVSHNMVVGPLLEDGVVDAWFSNDKQIQALFEDDFKEVGFATKVIKTKYNETLGVTVQVLGTEFAQKPASLVVTMKNSAVPAQQKESFPQISNQEVLEALNRYRESHTVHKLYEDQNLCTYAEKRVQDLLAFGTLDNHEGFRSDFADPNNLPQPIKDYNGKSIAENLAYQNCKNMTTGDSFIAQTGTALIEWCFDSSTLGHKEAQLSRDFGHACVRQGQGMFVVIFGAN